LLLDGRRAPFPLPLILGIQDRLRPRGAGQPGPLHRPARWL